MPFSDPTPVLVLPDTEGGRREQRKYVRTAVEHGDLLAAQIALCKHYREDTHLNTDQYARLRGLDVAQVNSWEVAGVCANRDTTGDRRYQWCFRCPAGYAFWAPKEERERKPGIDPDPANRIRV